MLAERKGRGGDCRDQLLLIIFPLALEHFHIKVSTVFCLIVHYYEHEYGSFFFALQTSSQSCSVNLTLSVNHHKSTFRAPAVKKLGRQERAALDTE